MVLVCQQEKTHVLRVRRLAAGLSLHNYAFHKRELLGQSFGGLGIDAPLICRGFTAGTKRREQQSASRRTTAKTPKEGQCRAGNELRGQL